jgi:RNA polymerase sigma factor (sigma-70 family)
MNALPAGSPVDGQSQGLAGAQPWYQDKSIFYEEMRNKLLRFVIKQRARLGIGEHHLDSEGIVHDAFVAVFERWTEIKNPQAYLYAVANRGIARAVLKSKNRADVDKIDDAIDSKDLTSPRWSSVARSTSVEDYAELKAILKSLGDLPGRQGVVAYLYRVAGWSHKEIAAHQGIKTPTSRRHLQEATEHLKSQWLEVLQQARTGWRPSRVWPAAALGVALAWTLVALTLSWMGASTVTAWLAPVVLAGFILLCRAGAKAAVRLRGIQRQRSPQSKQNKDDPHQ